MSVPDAEAVGWDVCEEEGGDGVFEEVHFLFLFFLSYFLLSRYVLDLFVVS